MLAEELTAFSGALTAAGGPSLPHLQTGLPEHDVRERLSLAGFDPHPDLVTWFAWHNGIDASAPITRREEILLAAWVPLSLDRAIDEAMRAMSRTRLWESSWVPIAENAWRGLLAILVDTSTGAVVRREGEDGEASPVGSLEYLVGAWRRSLESGLYWDDAEGQWALPEGAVLPRDVSEKHLL